MKRKIFALLVAVALSLTLFCGTSAFAAVPGPVPITRGTFSILGEDDSRLVQLSVLRSIAADALEDRGYSSDEFPDYSDTEATVWSSLQEAMTVLNAGSINSLTVSRTVGERLCAGNPSLTLPSVTWSEDPSPFVQTLLKPLLSDEFVFLMPESQTELRDAINDALAELQKDGTLDRLFEEAVAAADAGEPLAYLSPSSAEPIRLAVSGDLPPYDYTANDGTPAGFNLAVLTEIGSRIGRPVQAVTVYDRDRDTALQNGQADLLFCTLPGARVFSDASAFDALVAELPALSSSEQGTLDQLRSLLGLGFADTVLPDDCIATDAVATDFSVSLMPADTVAKLNYIRTGTPVPGLPVIVKDPISQTVPEGATVVFDADYQDAIFAVWHFVSPSGLHDVEYSEIQAAYPPVNVVNGMYSSMTLENVPMDLDGWKVYCRYSNDSGYMDTGWALLTVAPSGQTVNPFPQARVANDLTVYASNGAQTVLYQTEMGWFDYSGVRFESQVGPLFRSQSDGELYAPTPDAWSAP